jgi:hypothetical protein
MPGGISVAISQSTACELEIWRRKKNEGKREGGKKDKKMRGRSGANKRKKK